MIKLKNLKCNKTKKIKMWQKSGTQNVTKIKKSKYDKNKKNLKCDKTEKL